MEEQYVLSTEEEELVSNVQSSIIEGDQDYLPDNKKSSISDIQALLSNLGVSNGSTTSNNGVTTTNSAFISSAIRQLIPSIELQSLTKLQMESTRLIDSSVEELQSFNTISESKRNGNQGQVLSEQVHRLQKLMKRIESVSGRVDNLQKRINRKQMNDTDADSLHTI